MLSSFKLWNETMLALSISFMKWYSRESFFISWDVMHFFVCANSLTCLWICWKLDSHCQIKYYLLQISKLTITCAKDAIKVVLTMHDSQRGTKSLAYVSLNQRFSERLGGISWWDHGFAVCETCIPVNGFHQVWCQQIMSYYTWKLMTISL